MAIELVNKKENVSLQGNSANVNFMMPNLGKVKSVNGKTGDVVLTADDVGAVQNQYDTFQYGDGKWMLGINKEGKVKPTQNYSSPTLDSDALKDYATKEYVENYSQVVSAPIYRSEGNKHYINLRELVPNALYSIPKEIILQNSIANFNLVVLADDGTEQFIYATTRSELFYVSKIGSFLLLYIQGLSYYVQINCRNTATSTDITFNRYVQYLSSSINYEFTPTKDYHPATKKYVDDAVTNINIPVAEGAVSYAEAQNLTADERAQARKNIQKYDWRQGVFGGAIKFNYCDMLERINWEVAASMPDALGYNNNIMDYMAQMAKLLFESAPTANNDTMVKNIATNYKALRDAGGLSNSSITIGYPDNDDNLGFSIQMYAASNDANKITIKIYDNNMHSNAKTGYWIANSDGTVTKSISTINLDATLAKQSFYADAKAVGDRLAALEARIAALEGNV